MNKQHEVERRMRLNGWFRDSLKRISKSTGLTMRSLSAQMPLNYSYMSKMMNDRDTITPAAAAKLLKLAERHSVFIDRMPDTAPYQIPNIPPEQPSGADQAVTTNRAGVMNLVIHVTIEEGQVVGVSTKIV